MKKYARGCRWCLALVLAFTMWGCGSESQDDPVVDAGAEGDTGVEDIQVFPDVSLPADVGDEDVIAVDVQEEDVVEIAMPNCVEEVINPIQVGERIFYTCVSVGEGEAYQQIRTVKKSAKAIQVAAEVAPPERIGQVLKVSGDWLYFDTLLLDGGQVVERNIYRVLVEGGEVENVLTWTDDEAGALDQPLFSSSSLVMVFAPQPGDDRLAFMLGDLTTQTGSGHLYIYKDGEQDFVSEGAVSAFGWGFEGTSLVWVAGGKLMLAGVDGSGANQLDPAVFTTGIPPQLSMVLPWSMREPRRPCAFIQSGWEKKRSPSFLTTIFNTSQCWTKTVYLCSPMR